MVRMNDGCRGESNCKGPSPLEVRGLERASTVFSELRTRYPSFNFSISKDQSTTEIDQPPWVTQLVSAPVLGYVHSLSAALDKTGGFFSHDQYLMGYAVCLFTTIQKKGHDQALDIP